MYSLTFSIEQKVVAELSF